MILGACGGGGTSQPNQALNYKRTYTEPVPGSPSQPVVRLNTALSTDTIAVFDVVANEPSRTIRGVALNLYVDQTKVQFVAVPGGATGAVLGNVSTGGWGGSDGRAAGKYDAAGVYVMASSIRAPGAAQPAQGVLLRFALQLQGEPVAGVIRTIVDNGSGLLDERGRMVAGTAPVVGRLEMVRS
jgi:hypothetical protein